METTNSTANSKWVAIGLGLAACYAVYRFGPNNLVKGAAVGVMGTIIARQVPYVNTALAA